MKSKAFPTIIGTLMTLILFGGCQSAEPSIPPRQSVWGTIIHISQAPTINAPVIIENVNDIVTAWVDTSPENSAITQSMRSISGVYLSKTSELPLPPVFPFNQQLAPAAEDHIHLLWMDAAYDDINGGVRLWSSVVTPELVVERGPVRVTEPPVYHYDSVITPDSNLWIVWSTAPASEPNLRARWIDPVGRPRDIYTLTGNGDWPALVRTNNFQILLFWLDGRTHTLYRSRLQEGSLIETVQLTDSPALDTTDILTSFDAGLDTTYGYAVWNIQRGSGEHEVWVASGLLNGQNWTGAKRLGIAAEDAPFVTGFNGGSGFSATEGENFPQHAALMSGQYDHLIIAAQLGDGIGLIFMHNGQVQGYMQVAELESDFLLAPPSITTDNNRHLYVAWSEPVNENTANLLLTKTR